MEYPLNVDLKQKMQSVVPTFRQGDTATLKFRVFDDGRDYSLANYIRSELTFELPSGQTLLGNGTLVTENGKQYVRYDFVGAEMAEEGNVRVILTIFLHGHIVSVRPFTVHIYSNMRGDTLSYLSILQDLIAEVDEMRLELIRLTGEVNSAISHENQRQVNENERTVNENGRISNENTRLTNEANRVNSENVRNNNESTRISNENQRIENESNRQTQFSQSMTDVTNVINDANTLQSYVNQLSTELDIRIDGWQFIGTYDHLKQYIKHNVVELYGSTWIALQDTYSNQPPTLPQKSNAYWHLLAHRGVDGNGSVSSVNGVPPDINGDVPIEPFSIGAISESEFDLHVSKLNNFELKEDNGEVYFTFTNLYFFIDTDGEVYYRADGTGNAGASLGDELYVWKVI